MTEQVLRRPALRGAVGGRGSDFSLLTPVPSCNGVEFRSRFGASQSALSRCCPAGATLFTKRQLTFTITQGCPGLEGVSRGWPGLL